MKFGTDVFHHNIMERKVLECHIPGNEVLAEELHVNSELFPFEEALIKTGSHPADDDADEPLLEMS